MHEEFKFARQSMKKTVLLFHIITHVILPFYVHQICSMKIHFDNIYFYAIASIVLNVLLLNKLINNLKINFDFWFICHDCVLCPTISRLNPCPTSYSKSGSVESCIILTRALPSLRNQDIKQSLKIDNRTWSHISQTHSSKLSLQFHLHIYMIEKHSCILWFTRVEKKFFCTEAKYPVTFYPIGLSFFA